MHVTQMNSLPIRFRLFQEISLQGKGVRVPTAPEWVCVCVTGIIPHIVVTNHVKHQHDEGPHG